MVVGEDDALAEWCTGEQTKARFILHELISQIPLFWNYEKFILAYIKRFGGGPTYVIDRFTNKIRVQRQGKKGFS